MKRTRAQLAGFLTLDWSRSADGYPRSGRFRAFSIRSGQSWGISASRDPECRSEHTIHPRFRGESCQVTPARGRIAFEPFRSYSVPTSAAAPILQIGFTRRLRFVAGPLWVAPGPPAYAANLDGLLASRIVGIAMACSTA